MPSNLWSRLIATWVLTLLVSTPICQASYMDPHSPEWIWSWFEGWYIHIIPETQYADPPQQTLPHRELPSATAASVSAHRAISSLGLILGYVPRGQKGWTNSLVSLLIQHQDHRNYQVTSSNGSSWKPLRVLSDVSQNLNVTVRGQPIKEDPEPEVVPDFRIASETLDLQFKRKNQCRVSALVEDVQLYFECIGDPVPYASTGEPPEGFIAGWPTRAVGLHWYVHSVATPVAYTFWQHGSTPIHGKGIAHMEKNWGETFPAGWVWAQGLQTTISHKDSTSSSSFVLAGGQPPSPFVPGPLATDQWLLSVRINGTNWWFHPWDPTLYTITSNPCGTENHHGTNFHGGEGSVAFSSFHLTARQPLQGREVIISITAPLHTFTDVQCPTNEGFKAGSQQSYAGRAIVQLWQKERDGSRVLVAQERFTMGSVALEFGGDRRCASSTEPFIYINEV